MNNRSDCRILIVEDDPSSCQSLARFLRRHRFDVECADTVASAVSKLTAEVTHLILDLRLPDGTGLRVLERARTREPAVKVAVVTGLGRDDLLADAVLMHPDVFLTKLVDYSDVLAWLEGGLPPLHDYLAGAAVANLLS